MTTDNPLESSPKTNLDSLKKQSTPKSATGPSIGFKVFVLGLLLSIAYYFYSIKPQPTNVCSKYAIMIDAGSTGSRIHVYRFHQCSDLEPVKLEEEELFTQTIPGLSAYPDHPQKAAESLDGLLTDALQVVPVSLHRKTPLAVKATAGLRLLGQDKSDDILKAVRSHLETHYPFPIVGEDGVAIMDGRDEGVYAWITVNFLLGNLDTDQHTAAVLDLGGGSTQIVFEPDRVNGVYPEIPEGDHKYILKHDHREFLLYQHSYLGYGLMEARKRIHHHVLTKAEAEREIPHACLPRGLNWKYSKLEDPVEFLGEGSFDDCTRVADGVFNKDKQCAAHPCAFDGIYQPMIAEAFRQGPIYVFSYFYDRTQPLGLPVSFRLPDLASLTESVCSGEFLDNVTDLALKDELLDRPEWCLDLSFIYRLLSFGYEIPNDRDITVAKKINGVETGWCLGAAIAILGDSSLKNLD